MRLRNVCWIMCDGLSNRFLRCWWTRGVRRRIMLDIQGLRSSANGGGRRRSRGDPWVGGYDRGVGDRRLTARDRAELMRKG